MLSSSCDSMLSFNLFMLLSVYMGNTKCDAVWEGQNILGQPQYQEGTPQPCLYFLKRRESGAETLSVVNSSFTRTNILQMLEGEAGISGIKG